jgi:hypothetical protein
MDQPHYLDREVLHRSVYSASTYVLKLRLHKNRNRSVVFGRQEPARVEHIKQHHGRDDHPAVKVVCGNSSGRIGQRLAVRTY